MSTNVVLDLETTGVNSNAGIASIGAVVVEDFEKQFYSTLDWRNEHTATQDVSTISWWMQQTGEALKEFNDENAPNSRIVLFEFNKWLDSLQAPVFIWGNGSDFDNVILLNLYRRLEVQKSNNWAYNSNRCFRTLRTQFPNIKSDDINSCPHHALHDALHEAKHLSKILYRSV